MSRASFLMCRPTHYGVSYVINPWMNIRRQPDRALALRQWSALKDVLEKNFHAAVFTIRQRVGLPDMTFTANAGLVYRRTFVPSRFKYAQRAGEEPYFATWFRAKGYKLMGIPPGCHFEGAGDALFMGKNLFSGFRFRSDICAHQIIGEALDIRVISVELVNPYFYHLDTCFMPITDKLAIYYPAAFDRYGRRVLKQNVPELIPVREPEAYSFGCNAVSVGKKVVISKPCRFLARDLKKRGFTVYPLDLSEFAKAGGAARCLTLRLT
jgi:N-dimethylarginine dimethylaminohydrolase